MDLVALTELAGPIEAEATALAPDLGITAYEARQRLAAGLPCVLLATTDRARTVALLTAVRARGHGALACDSHAIVPSAAMTLVRRFHFDADALTLDPLAAGGEPMRIAYADLLALVRASHRRSTETHEETKEKKFRPAAAIATGGVILTKTVTRDVVRTSEEREQVLYIFRKGEPPCLLREGAAQYAGLGDAVRPTRVENFLTTCRLLAERAPAAPLDDRLLQVKRFPEPPNDPGAPRTFDAETGGVDALAHILAMWRSRKR